MAFSRSFLSAELVLVDEKTMFPDARIEVTLLSPHFEKTLQTSAIFMLVPFTFTPRRNAQ